MRNEEPAGGGRSPRNDLYRYASLGAELGAAIIGLTLAGLWVDYAFGTRPVGVIVGAGLGVVGGLYNFIRQALQMSRGPGGGAPGESREADEEKRDAP